MTTFHYQDFDKKEITFVTNNDLALCLPDVREKIKSLLSECIIRALLITDIDHIHVIHDPVEFNIMREKFPQAHRTETCLGTDVDSTARLVKMFAYRNVAIWETDPDAYIIALGWN